MRGSNYSTSTLEMYGTDNFTSEADLADPWMGSIMNAVICRHHSKASLMSSTLPNETVFLDGAVDPTFGTNRPNTIDCQGLSLSLLTREYLRELFLLAREAVDIVTPW